MYEDIYLYKKIRKTFGVSEARRLRGSSNTANTAVLPHRAVFSAQGAPWAAPGAPRTAQCSPRTAQGSPRTAQGLPRAAQGAPRARPERPRARPGLAQSRPGRWTSPHVRAQRRLEPARGRLCALRACARPPCALARLRLCVRICSSKKLFDKAVSGSTETSFSYTLHSLTRFSFPL